MNKVDLREGSDLQFCFPTSSAAPIRQSFKAFIYLGNCCLRNTSAVIKKGMKLSREFESQRMHCLLLNSEIMSTQSFSSTTPVVCWNSRTLKRHASCISSIDDRDPCIPMSHLSNILPSTKTSIRPAVGASKFQFRVPNHNITELPLRLLSFSLN